MFLMAALLLSPVVALNAQQMGTGSSSSSSSGKGASGDDVKRLSLPSVQQVPAEPAPPPVAQPAAMDPSGPAVSLETSEALFDVAVALNTCGYDNELEQSDAVRAEVRAEVNQALEESAAGRDARDGMCTYIRQHRLSDPGRDLAQYISLALYLTPPPALAPSADETEMPPDSTQVVNMLPLLRRFATAIHLRVIWVKHHPDYEELLNLVRDPLTQMIFNTNIYLKQPTSTYDGRRFLVLLEPMLAPGQTNARIYDTNYIVVASPSRKVGDSSVKKASSKQGNDPVNLTQIRHTYLHYEIEPLVYAKASSMERLLPLLKTVRDAPLDFTYKSDIVALLTECLIRAIEARTLDIATATGLVPPQKPGAVKQRAELEKYDQEETTYLRQAEAARRNLVQKDMRQGYVLTEYFYQEMSKLEKEPVSLKEDLGELIYGMDVDHQRQEAEKVVFYAEGSSDVVRRAPRVLRGLDLAEMDLIKGDTASAKELAQKALEDKSGDPARANYLLARIQSMQGEMGDAIGSYQATLKLSRDPRTLAWSHIYLGRIYDIQNRRPEAVAEYKAALTVRDGQADTKSAAEKGLKEQFQSKRQLQAQADGSDGGAAQEPAPAPAPAAAPDTGKTGARAPAKLDLSTPVPMVLDDNTPLPPALPPAKPKK